LQNEVGQQVVRSAKAQGLVGKLGGADNVPIAKRQDTIVQGIEETALIDSAARGHYERVKREGRRVRDRAKSVRERYPSARDIDRRIGRPDVVRSRPGLNPETSEAGAAD
jgi:hypothetical protein